MCPVLPIGENGGVEIRPRYLETFIAADLKRKMVLLAGPRQVGKTTLAMVDVAAHKYPPVWVTTAALWSAMNTVDSSENRTRGFISVSHRNKAPKTIPLAKEVSGI